MATLKLVKIDYAKNKNSVQKCSQYNVVIAETNEPLTGIQNAEITMNDRGQATLTIKCLDFKLEQKNKKK